MQPHEVIIRPLLTEKGQMGVEERNEYPFAVNAKANKIEIRQAVSRLFKVRVTGVRTCRVPGKRRRKGMSFGSTSPWKKAIVCVHPEDRLDFV